MMKLTVLTDEEEKKVVIDPKALCEELGLLVLDPVHPDAAKDKFVEVFSDFRIINLKDFEDTKELCEGNDWLLFKSMDQVHQAAKDDSPGLIELDLEKDPDPFGNHGISILDRLAAMGWPADRVMIQDRREQVRPEDLL